MPSDKNDQKNEGDEQISIQPIKEVAQNSKLNPFNANPGPARTAEMPDEEGSKEDRQAKKAELNK